MSKSVLAKNRRALGDRTNTATEKLSEKLCLSDYVKCSIEHSKQDLTRVQEEEQDSFIWEDPHYPELYNYQGNEVLKSALKDALNENEIVMHPIIF